MTGTAVALQVLQVLTVLVCAPLLPGVINHLKANAQSRVGPPILKPYFDYFKLLRKGSVTNSPT